MTALPELTTTISSKQLSRLACHASSRNLVFVDGGVATHQTASPSEEKLLLEQMLGNSGQPQAPYNLATPTTPIAEVVQLQPDQDSIAQISQVLAAHQGLESVHLTVSGQPGCLTLGTTPLSLESLDRHADQLQTWATAFSADGELVISGYKVAKATEGKRICAAALSSHGDYRDRFDRADWKCSAGRRLGTQDACRRGGSSGRIAFTSCLGMRLITSNCRMR